ncbi:MAG: ferritin-like domain-containing protein [Bacteroidetes bacterium]|nr:ferritin-like domain-containing protein [Bacteroidota bacterium]
MQDTIDTPTRTALIEGLNTDLAHEYQAILMYNSYAAMVYGMHRPTLKQFFETELPEELAHAQLLADKITALGGTPAIEPAPFDPASEPTAMLHHVLEAETETIERYVERRRQAEEAGAYGLAAELDDIIRDETTHKEETEKLLRDIKQTA